MFSVSLPRIVCTLMCLVCTQGEMGVLCLVAQDSAFMCVFKLCLGLTSRALFSHACIHTYNLLTVVSENS